VSCPEMSIKLAEGGREFVFTAAEQEFFAE